MSNILTATPAYGREYKDQEQVLKDWREGKDFRLVYGPYFSIRDLDALAEAGFNQIDIEIYKRTTGCNWELDFVVEIQLN